MPYYSEYLLSSYDKDFQSVPEYYPPPTKIPPQVLASLRQVEGVSFAQLPRELQGKRNVISILPPKKQGRFRSEKSRRTGGVSTTLSPSYIAHAPRSHRLRNHRLMYRVVPTLLVIINELRSNTPSLESRTLTLGKSAPLLLSLLSI